MNRFFFNYLLCAACGICMLVLVFPIKLHALEQAEKFIFVPIDRASLYHALQPVTTVIIGNPGIADVTIESEKILILTGRSFGTTNLIMLDKDNKQIAEETIVVRSNEDKTVRVYRRNIRETLACSPICEPALAIGDNESSFNFISDQISIKKANSRSEN